MNFPLSLEQQNVKIIAHRGLSSIFPENTLEAIEAALFSSDLV
jgi:glycerophosphoryl diester phosphodiesterase